MFSREQRKKDFEVSVKLMSIKIVTENTFRSEEERHSHGRMELTHLSKAKWGAQPLWEGVAQIKL